MPVASHDLASGDRIGADDVTLREWPADLAPSGIPGSIAGRTLAAPVRAGEPVTSVRLVGSDLAQAHPGLTVLPVRLPDPAVVDLLEVGDRVDLSAVDPESGTAQELAGGVVVLAIPPPSVAESSLTGRLVVLGISPDRAADVAAAALTQFLSVAYVR
ncbi:SAF domain-containing protein [Nocardioides piscis]|uniref:SAF domain-containing protein n=1 Tax=Nocardioides piscis TaxID=2714938 RepID=A0A6G7YCA9_9ACTN|nr:SAF domain-containing protein [Nocardioides piscis]QIK74400.1 hypothetical protein G7071_02050 [Nocardioides piscis]